MFDAFHETGEKTLLRGGVLPAGQTGMEDIEGAVDNLFEHPNVGPFIGKLLIQRLVTSNPSPSYVARVAQAFNGDEESPRGDMKAVVRAILTDPEALDAERIREPFQALRSNNQGTRARVGGRLLPGFGVSSTVSDRTACP